MKAGTLIFLIMMWMLIMPGSKAAEAATGTRASGEPHSSREDFRGAWLATVANLDWPAAFYQPVADQKADAIALLDSLKIIGINAVLFQVRPESDAFYASSYDPWSYWLTGEQGRAPDPFYDPLSFMVREAHSRGMELHAWLNPYRVERKKGSYNLAGSHISRRQPGWILEFESRPDEYYTMLDPGLPEVRDYVTNVVVDIVRRYDVDGIHFDDYFYPYYPVTNQDSLTWLKHHNHIGNIEDWRRNNVNKLVAQVHDSLQALAPHVVFGISPFGIRKNTDAGTAAFEGYYRLYADPLAWLKSRTIDYIAPQLYYEPEHERAPYALLLDYWSRMACENQRHIYAGLAPYRILPPMNWSLEQAFDQLQINLNNVHVRGKIFFRARFLVANPKGYSDRLRNKLYRYPALTPSMPWKNQSPPPQVERLSASWSDDGRVILTWAKPDRELSAEEHGSEPPAEAVRYAVYRIDSNFKLMASLLAKDMEAIANALSRTSDDITSVRLNGSSEGESKDRTDSSRTGETEDRTDSSREGGSKDRTDSSRAGGSENQTDGIPDALAGQALSVQNMVDVTGQRQYVDRWPENRTAAVYAVTAVSHNSIESRPVMILVRKEGNEFRYKLL